MLRISNVREMKLVDAADVEFVEKLAKKFKAMPDDESRIAGTAVLAVLERLGLIKTPETKDLRGREKSAI